MVGFASFGLLGTFPLDIRQDTWFSGATWLVWGMILAGGIYGATTAIGKQR